VSDANTSSGQLAACDLKPGDILARRTVIFDQGTFSAFASLTGDNHPIHYDVAYATARGLRAPIAHGLLLVAMTALGATAISDRLHASMVAMVGTEAKFLGPAYLDDAVRIELRVGEIIPKSKGVSLARFDAELFSETQELLARVSHRFLLKTTL
jgi:3-hydroxybutyryl-CoA dehydratase